MRKTLSAAVTIYLVVVATAVGRTQQAAPDNAIEQLQQRLDRGEVTLTFEEEFGYLRSVLRELSIDPSSQTLVFSKTSLASEYVSPFVPRAIYFNDQVYVARTRGVPLEIAAIGANQAPVFYTLDQQPGGAPKFQRDDTCLLCHDPTRSGVTHLIMRSHIVDREGNALQTRGATSLIRATSDRSPLVERWGGWYVTGTHGGQRHLGNIKTSERIDRIPAAERVRYAAGLDTSAGANITDLRPYFDVTLTLTPDSDIVALAVLAHQVNVQNLMADATRAATGTLVEAAAERLVREMLFVGEAGFSSPIQGTTSFASEFRQRDRSAGGGRSLRELDLTRRLMRFPLSYLIYSKSYDALPPRVRTYVEARLQSILAGDEQRDEFRHLTPDDRAAILQILRETKPDVVRGVAVR